MIFKIFVYLIYDDLILKILVIFSHLKLWIAAARRSSSDRILGVNIRYITRNRIMIYKAKQKLTALSGPWYQLLVPRYCVCSRRPDFHALDSVLLYRLGSY